jgi:hypothetical protein
MGSGGSKPANTNAPKTIINTVSNASKSALNTVTGTSPATQNTVTVGQNTIPIPPAYKNNSVLVQEVLVTYVDSTKKSLVSVQKTRF